MLGVSIDSFAAQGEYCDKLGLSFPLLSDFPRHETASAFDAFMDERSVNKRVTFVIDRDRVIRGRYEDARNMEAHAEEALKVLATLK